MGKSRLICAPAAALAAAWLTQPALARSATDIFRMTPSDFARGVTVRDDALEIQATIDTRKSWIESPSDAFLRAFIDKRTGAVTYQLYVSTTYFGDWRFYDRINYRDENDQVQEAPLIRIDSQPDCASLHYSTRCKLTEDVAFDIPEEIIRRLALAYNPAAPSSWRFKLKGKYQNTDVLNGVVPAEAAALVMAVSAYKTRPTH